MVEFTIPIGVARVVNTSSLFDRNRDIDPNSTIGKVLGDFDRATNGGWHRNPGRYTAEEYQTMIDVLGAIQGEQFLSPAQTKAFERFREELSRRLTAQTDHEKQEAEEAAKQEAKS